jgi:hypothetical protein
MRTFGRGARLHGSVVEHHPGRNGCPVLTRTKPMYCRIRGHENELPGNTGEA